jgi:two-component system response regulator PrrA
MPNVLIIDDDTALVRMLRLTLRDGGFDVASASNGREALESVSEHEPDVIVLDLQMPVMDGRTFFHELRSRGFDVPVLILSANDGRRAQRELNAEGYLDKPFSPDVLVREVARLA